MDSDVDHARRIANYSTMIRVAAEDMRMCIDSGRALPPTVQAQFTSLHRAAEAVLDSIKGLTVRLEQKTASEVVLQKLQTELDTKSAELSSLESRKNAEIEGLKAQIDSRGGRLNRATEELDSVTAEFRASRLNSIRAAEYSGRVARLQNHTSGQQNDALHSFDRSGMDNVYLVPAISEGRDELARFTSRQSDIPATRPSSFQRARPADISHAAAAVTAAAERSKRPADDMSESEAHRTSQNDKRPRRTSFVQDPSAAIRGATTPVSTVTPPAGIIRARLNQAELHDKAASILSLVHLDWDRTDQEVAKITEQLTSLFTRGRAVNDVKQAIDKHVVGNFRKQPPFPRSCLFATLTGEAAGEGGPYMLRKDCPYCKSRETICVWAQYPVGVASAYGPRSSTNNMVLDTRWRSDPTPYAVAVEGRQIRWIFQKRAESYADSLPR